MAVLQREESHSRQSMHDPVNMDYRNTDWRDGQW